MFRSPERSACKGGDFSNTMVSNRMNAHKEMRYWPLLCGSAEDGSYYKQEVPEQLARPASQQRKDTKDSGIGECVSECEEVRVASCIT